MSSDLLKASVIDGLTSHVRNVVFEACGKVGEIVPIPDDVAGQINDQMTLDTAARVLEVRRRERSVPADVLAIRLA